MSVIEAAQVQPQRQAPIPIVLLERMELVTTMRQETLERALHERALLDFADEVRAEGDDRYELLFDDPDEYFAIAHQFENDIDLPPDRLDDECGAQF